MKSLIIHHWDTDGICSAAQLLEILGFNADLFVPDIGCYWIKDQDLKMICKRNYNTIYVVDLSLSSRDLIKLRNCCNELIVFDHHKIKDFPNGITVVNPYLNRGEMLYPSTSWVIKEYFGKKLDLLSVLGAIGDNEYEIKNFQVFKDISRFLTSIGISLEDAIRMVHLIDSNYRVNDKDGVIRAVKKMLDYKENPREILSDVDWTQKLKIIEREINKWIDAPMKEYGRILLKKIHTRYNIISTVTRRISWANPGKICVVVNTGFSEDNAQMYIREYKTNVDISWIIKVARSLGFSAGGRSDVVGLVIPKDRLDILLSYILSALK